MAGEQQSGTGSSVKQWISIDGNIKQQYLPFVLRPGNKLNLNANAGGDLPEGPQFFSFKNKNPDDFNAGFGRLNICPSTVFSPEFKMLFNKDISNRLLYDYGSLEPVTIDSIFDQLPSIQIREYQVDSQLDQFLTVFSDVFNLVGDFLGAGISNINNNGLGEGLKKLWDAWSKFATGLGDFLVGQGKYKDGPNFMLDSQGNSRWETACKAGTAGLAAAGPMGAGLGFVAGAALGPAPIDTFIEKFPFIMYYKLQSYSTLNVYELPCILDEMWQTKGTDGWKGNKGFGLVDLMGGKDSMMSKAISMLGGMGDDLLDRVRINYMPRWDAGEGVGNSSHAEDVTVKFTLFNDTEQAAMMNFIFINTIVPNNTWLQYGMFTHSPCLYDVKIAGHKRLFCCAGEFNVKPVGLMRTPSRHWITELCNKYVNGDSTKTYAKRDPAAMINAILTGDLIKIPDAYEVTLKFASMLPMNFNNFLYNYSRNGNIYNEYKNKPLHQDSVFSEVLKGLKSDIKNIAETQISAMNSPPPPPPEKKKKPAGSVIRTR